MVWIGEGFWSACFGVRVGLAPLKLPSNPLRRNPQMQVRCFKYDHWEQTEVAELRAGDQIIVGGRLLRVSAPPYVANGQLHLPADPVRPEPAVLAFTASPLAEVMDLVGSTVQQFEDGTAIVADLKCPEAGTFSPRLSMPALEQFCAMHLRRYRAFYEKNRAEIDDGQPVQMTRWW